METSKKKVVVHAPSSNQRFRRAGPAASRRRRWLSDHNNASGSGSSLVALFTSHLNFTVNARGPRKGTGWFDPLIRDEASKQIEQAFFVDRVSNRKKKQSDSTRTQTKELAHDFWEREVAAQRRPRQVLLLLLYIYYLEKNSHRPYTI
jgi:hypothetical protein